MPTSSRSLYTLQRILGGILLLGGLYLLFVSLSPLFSRSLPAAHQPDVAQKLTTIQPKDSGQRLYIPKINVDVTYQSGDASALEGGAWWRSPASGNPKDGGNFVLAAHRFQMGWTPAQTVRQSPFYHIDKLEMGDEITVDYDGKRYTYKITNISKVAPDATEIEKPTDDARLTLYTCTLNGENDGREVIVAEQL